MAVCLLAPVLFAVIRKLTPGQPVYLSAGAGGVVLAAGLWALSQGRRLPQYIALPLATWALFQTLYALLSVGAGDPFVGLTALYTRVLPMFMSAVAFAAFRVPRDLGRACLPLCLLSPLHLVLCVIVSNLGSGFLPWWLRAISTYAATPGETWKGQFPSASGLFTTPADLSQTMLTATFLALTVALTARAKRAELRMWTLMAFSAASAVYLVGERTSFLWVLAGWITYLWITRGRGRFYAMAATMATLLLFVWAERHTEITGRDIQTRSEAYTRQITAGELRARAEDVVLSSVVRWAKAYPLGNYLGYAGTESASVGKAGYMEYGFVEVGAGQLIAETGVAGLCLMTLVVAVVIYRVSVRARGLASRKQVIMLLLFFACAFLHYALKGEASLTRLSVTQLAFWSVPGICAAIIAGERRGNGWPAPTVPRRI